MLQDQCSENKFEHDNDGRTETDVQVCHDHVKMKPPQISLKKKRRKKPPQMSPSKFSPERMEGKPLRVRKSFRGVP
jgi:hypothetical protein